LRNLGSHNDQVNRRLPGACKSIVASYLPLGPGHRSAMSLPFIQGSTESRPTVFGGGQRTDTPYQRLAGTHE
jgi:hypothetical protein